MLAFALLACGQPDPSGETAWAVNYASVTPADEGLIGHHVWLFYAEGWDEDRDPGWFQCSLVQELTGEAIDPVEGCLECEAMYALTLETLETDCPAGLIVADSWETIDSFGIGAVPPDIADLDPFPGRDFGWYLSYDGQLADSQGFAYAEELESGAGDPAEGWVEEQRYTLWPAYAWEL